MTAMTARLTDFRAMSGGSLLMRRVRWRRVGRVVGVLA